MIRKISHIGIAVENLEGAKKFFEDNFSLPGSEKESFGELLFSFISFEDAGARLELLQSTTDEGQMAKFISKRGPGIHHIALEVDNIDRELRTMADNGIQLIDKEGREGVAGQIGFLHPKSVNGVLVELVQPRCEGE